MIDQGLTPARYPESAHIRILHGENWEYLKQLSRRIGEFSKYELLAALDIVPNQMGDPSFGGRSLKKPALETSNRTVAPDTGRADLYLMVFKPDELLKVGRVLRYRGQPIAIESPEHGSGYQRILIPHKLNSIAKFIGTSPSVVFPSTLTVVLSSDCQVENIQGNQTLRNVVIPDRYASLDIIDGQHRLFAYAQDDLAGLTKDDSALLVTAIKFKTDKPDQINRFAARTFVSINSTHTRVKRSLTDLIAYDVLRDTGSRSIAGKIVFECTSSSNKSLSKVFQTSEFSPKSTDGLAPIPTVSVVNELAKVLDLMKYEKDGKLSELEKTFGCSALELQNHKKLVKKGVEILEKYFSAVNQAFPKDWRNPQSNLMCAKYLAGFMRFLGHFAQEGISAQDFELRLKSVRAALVAQYYSGQQDHDGLEMRMKSLG